MGYLTVSVDMKFGPGVVGKFWVKVMRLHLSCWSRLESSQGLTGAVRLALGFLTKLLLAVGQRPQFHAIWISPWGCS